MLKTYRIRHFESGVLMLRVNITALASEAQTSTPELTQAKHVQTKSAQANILTHTVPHTHSYASTHRNKHTQTKTNRHARATKRNPK